MVVNGKQNNKTLSRREREKLAHRREIMDAAARLFARKGFFNATLEEIAQEAEFSKGTIYLYFSNKEDLLYSIIEDKMGEYVQSLQNMLSGKKSFKQELHDYFKNAAEVAFRDADFFSLLMTLHARGFKTFSLKKAEYFKSAHDRVIEFATNRARKARDDGELRDIPPEAVNGMIHGAMDNMLMTRWNFETQEELQEGVDCFIDILFNGIAKEKEISK